MRVFHCYGSFSPSLIMLSMVAGVAGAASVAGASVLTVDVYPYHFELPESISAVCYEQDNCPEIEVSYVNSNQSWVTDTINREINGSFLGETASVADGQVTFDGYYAEVSPAVVASFEEFAQSQFNNESSIPYSLYAKPQYLGHVDDLELFSIYRDLNLGGAHGMPTKEYLILDPQLERALTLDDLMIDGQRAQYEALLETAFHQWIEQDLGNDVESYQQTWPFVVSEEIMFSAKGLVTNYQPYEIAGYAMGMPELVISYDQLEGIMKPIYLEKAKQLTP